MPFPAPGGPTRMEFIFRHRVRGRRRKEERKMEEWMRTLVVFSAQRMRRRNSLNKSDVLNFSNSLIVTKRYQWRVYYHALELLFTTRRIRRRRSLGESVGSCAVLPRISVTNLSSHASLQPRIFSRLFELEVCLVNTASYAHFCLIRKRKRRHKNMHSPLTTTLEERGRQEFAKVDLYGRFVHIYSPRLCIESIGVSSNIFAQG